DQHRHALIVDVEEILQVAEPIRLPHRVDRRIRQTDAVAARQRKHQLRLQTALDVNVQLAFGEPRDQSVGVMHAKQRRLSDATAIPTAFARARIIRSGEYRQSPPYPAGNPVPRYDLEHIPPVLTHFVIAGHSASEDARERANAPAIHLLRKNSCEE